MTRTGLFARILAVVGLASAPALANEQIVWPDLPTEAFIKDRPATTDDVAAGNAVFSMAGKSEGPLPIEIPQYVLWTDEEGVTHPKILIQAELAPDGTEIVGLRSFDGSDTAATLPEVRLLGTQKPE